MPISCFLCNTTKNQMRRNSLAASSHSVRFRERFALRRANSEVRPCILCIPCMYQRWLSKSILEWVILAIGLAYWRICLVGPSARVGR